MLTEEQRQRQREHQKRYRDSEKGRAAHLRAQRKYLATDAGREVTRESNRLKRKSNPGRDAAYARTAQMTRRGRVPAWADFSAITEIYELAASMTQSTGIDYQVDHIVPLRSPIVSGLHCEANLRVITATENAQKGNMLWPEMPDDPQDVVRFFGITGRGRRVARAIDIVG